MNEKRTTPGGGRRSKHTAPTIDLSATEVQPAAAEPVQESSKEPSQEPVEKAAPEPPPEQIVDPPRADAPNSPPTDSWTSIRRYITAPVLAAGFAGAAAMTVLLFVFWLT